MLYRTCDHDYVMLRSVVRQPCDTVCRIEAFYTDVSRFARENWIIKRFKLSILKGLILSQCSISLSTFADSITQMINVLLAGLEKKSLLKNKVNQCNTSAHKTHGQKKKPEWLLAFDWYEFRFRFGYPFPPHGLAGFDRNHSPDWYCVALK